MVKYASMEKEQITEDNDDAGPSNKMNPIFGSEEV
jgi:hypothetical protein